MHFGIKRVAIWSMLGLPVMLGGCLTSIPTEDLQAQETLGESFIVKQGAIDNQESFIAHTEAIQTSQVASKIGGKIEKIFVKKGDKVSAGQILATLDDAESVISYQSSQQILSALQQSYNNSQKMFDAQIEAMQNKVEQAKIGRELSTLTNGEDLGTAGRKIEQSKLQTEAKTLELEHSIQILQQQEIQLYSNAQNALSNSKILLEDVGEFIDKLLGISEINKHQNNSFENYLGAKDIQQKNEVEQKRRTLSEAYQNLGIEEAIDATTEFSEEEKTQILKSLEATEIFLQNTNSLLDEVSTVLDNSIVGINLPQNTIDSYKSQVSLRQNNLESMILTAQGNYLMGVKGSKQAIQNFNNQSAMQIDLLTKQKELIEQQFEVDKESLLQSNKASEQQYQEALAGLTALQKQKDAELSQIMSQIAQIQGQKQLAGQNIDNANIYAPFDGTITEKYMEIGQVVGPGTPIVSVSNLKAIKLVSHIPETLAQNITTQNTGIAHFESLKTDCVIKIYTIAPSADTMTKKREIEFLPIDCDETSLTAGLYAKISLNENTNETVLVANDFIEYQYGEAYVYKKTEELKKIPIQIQDCDGIYCGVTGDLEAGDTIVKR